MFRRFLLTSGELDTNMDPKRMTFEHRSLPKFNQISQKCPGWSPGHQNGDPGYQNGSPGTKKVPKRHPGIAKTLPTHDSRHLRGPLPDDCLAGPPSTGGLKACGSRVLAAGVRNACPSMCDGCVLAAQRSNAQYGRLWNTCPLVSPVLQVKPRTVSALRPIALCRVKVVYYCLTLQPRLLSRCICIHSSDPRITAREHMRIMSPVKRQHWYHVFLMAG